MLTQGELEREIARLRAALRGDGPKWRKYRAEGAADLASHLSQIAAGARYKLRARCQLPYDAQDGIAPSPGDPSSKLVVIEPLKRGVGQRIEPVFVRWDGVPNDAMEPDNHEARLIHEAWRRSIYYPPCPPLLVERAEGAGSTPLPDWPRARRHNPVAVRLGAVKRRLRHWRVYNHPATRREYRLLRALWRDLVG